MLLKSLFENTTSLADLYSADELEDDTEALYRFADEETAQTQFPIQIMTPSQAEEIETFNGDMTVMDAYEQYAESYQRKWIEEKIKYWDDDRVVVIHDNKLLDGNHHLVAGIVSQRNVKYINIAGK